MFEMYAKSNQILYKFQFLNHRIILYIIPLCTKFQCCFWNQQHQNITKVWHHDNIITTADDDPDDSIIDSDGQAAIVLVTAAAHSFLTMGVQGLKCRKLLIIATLMIQINIIEIPTHNFTKYTTYWHGSLPKVSWFSYRWKYDQCSLLYTAFP